MLIPGTCLPGTSSAWWRICGRHKHLEKKKGKLQAAIKLHEERIARFVMNYEPKEEQRDRLDKHGVDVPSLERRAGDRRRGEGVTKLVGRFRLKGWWCKEGKDLHLYRLYVTGIVRWSDFEMLVAAGFYPSFLLYVFLAHRETLSLACSHRERPEMAVII